ncbi:MAG: hypothetical protein WC050_00350 [Candidatus Paceibacterota bacterium]
MAGLANVQGRSTIRRLANRYLHDKNGDPSAPAAMTAGLIMLFLGTGTALQLSGYINILALFSW